MALYLQMDGVDDFLKLPSMTLTRILAEVSVTRKTDKTRFLWDFRAGIGFSYLQQLANGTDTKGSGTVLVNGVTLSGGNPIPSGVKCIIDHTLPSGTDDGNIFSDQNNQNVIQGNIYNIKIYNGVSLLAHYDMTTGTVQDQSGNGRHATLTGGIWLDDGVGGDPGTDGSTVFDLRQSIYADSFSNADFKQVIYSDASITADTKQSLYADSSVQHDMRNVIYQDDSTSHDLRQSLYEILSTVIDTKQVIYEDSATVFDMLQEIFNDGMIGSAHFDMRIQLYADDSTVFDSKQSWYEDNSFKADLAQAIYESGLSQGDMKLVIYADSSTKADTLQTIFSDSYTFFDTKQTMFESSYTTFDLRNEIYQPSSILFDTRQSIYLEHTTDYPLYQYIYESNSTDFDTLQQILDGFSDYQQVFKYLVIVNQNMEFNMKFSGNKNSFDLKI